MGRPRLRRVDRELSLLRRLAGHEDGQVRPFPRLLELSRLPLHAQTAAASKRPWQTAQRTRNRAAHAVLMLRGRILLKGGGFEAVEVPATVILQFDGHAGYSRLTWRGRKGGVAPGTDWRLSGDGMTSQPSPTTGCPPGCLERAFQGNSVSPECAFG